MNTSFSFKEDDSRIVYVRAVKDGELPDDVSADLASEPLYAVHAPDGARLAIVQGRSLAFALARQNDFAPVTVH